jgi:DNA modification methylase
VTTPTIEREGVAVYHGDSLDVLADLPANSVDAIVTDPPYGLAELPEPVVTAAIKEWITGDRSHVPNGKGFMGREWDKFVPPPALWDQAHRVLKPGGYLLAFAGSRTQDLMALSIRLAGFELRDSIAWLYGSGFPKNLDLTDAMARHLAGESVPDHRTVIRPGVYDVTAFLRDARDAAGWSNKQLDALFGTNGMAGHWTSGASQPAVPSVRQWEILKTELGFDDSMDALVAELGSTERPEDWGAGATDDRAFLDSLRKDPDAVGGDNEWGTALKPGYEPVVLARKTFKGTATANVITHGTGGLHIAACRTDFVDDADRSETVAKNRHADFGTQPCQNNVYGDYSTTAVKNYDGDAGRWPTNVALDDDSAVELGDPARFFPRFRYEAKPPGAERPRIDGIAHPTVKPLGFMRWLCRLVATGGTVLDPFAGSGTTVEACLLEGIPVIAVEREDDFIPLIRQRIDRRRDPVAAVLAAGGDAGLFDLFGEGGDVA